MTNWPSRPAPDDLNALKCEVDLVALCGKLGIDLDQEGDRWVGQCPVHRDSDPSFGVYITDKGYARAGCWSCAFDEDAYGLVQAVNECSFGEAVQVVKDAVNEGLTRESRPVDDTPLPDLAPMYAAGESAQAATLLADVWSDKSLPVADVPWIVSEFKLAGDHDALMIPFLAEDGHLVALKNRYPGTKPLSVRGSKLRVLYGSHRDAGQPRVVLCEGESDTWRTAALLQPHEDTLVLGLPSGVSAKPAEEWLDRLASREIVLLFDADDAGRQGARTWAVALEGRCKVAVLADGLDACQASDHDVIEAVDGARPALIGDSTLKATDSGYMKLSAKGEPVPVSSFTITCRSKVELDEDIVYEVTLDDEEMPHQIPASAFASARAMKAWANPRQRVWFGTDGDAQQLLREMQVQSCYVPRIRGTSVAGWHDGSFVLPDGIIGSQGWAYVPPVADVRLARHLSINEADWDALVLPTLAELHSPQVTTPILGWLAAAPLRALFRCFPVLAVTGGSGFGKTTLVQANLGAFGYDISCVLTATTPHAVQSFGSSTNAFPVWYDEYRAGARQDTKTALDQLIRDAWDGKASVKGGQSENRSQLAFMDATAPLVVTGEDAFTETSHAERMIVVPIRGDGRNPEALMTLRELDATGLGYEYLAWLRHRHIEGTLPMAPDVPERMSQALATVRWGYDLLTEFARDFGARLPNWDDSLITAQQKQARHSGGPYVSMLRELLGVTGRDGMPLVWLDGSDVLVRITPAVLHCKRETEITLPGNAQAATTWLTDVFDGEDEVCPWGGRQLRLHGAEERL